MSTGGLEPPQLSPHAPQACVSTIPPHRQKCWYLFADVDWPFVVEGCAPSRKTIHWIVFLGRVPHRHKLLVNIANVERLLVVEVLRTLSQNVTFSHLSPCLLALNGSTDKAIRFIRSPSARKQFGRVPHRQKLLV